MFDIIGARKAGIPDDEIAQELSKAYNYDYDGAKRAGIATGEILGQLLSRAEAGTTKSMDTPSPESQMPWYQRAAIGAGYGMEQGALGIGQRIAEMQGPTDMGMEGPTPPTNQPNPLLDAIKARASSNRQAYAPLQSESDKSPWYNPTAQGVGQVVGNLAVTAPIQPGGGVGKSALGIATRAATQGATQGFLQPTIGDESAIQNAGIGALAGGVVGMGGAAVGKVGNALMDRLPPNMTEALAKRYGIRTTLGEATGNPLIQRAETWLERIPLIGLKGFREKQHSEADVAAKSLLGRYIYDPASPDTMKGNREYASSLFNTLKTKVEDVGDQSIKPEQTRVVASRILDDYPDIFKKFQNTKRESLIKDIAHGTEPSNDSMAVLSNLYGMPTTSQPKTLTFEEAWTLRQGLGEMIGQARKKLATGEVDRSTLSELSQLYGAVNNDIDGWAASIQRPDIREAIDAANQAYKHYVVKYDIIQRAYDKAAGVSSAKELFSPKTFSTDLKKIVYKDQAFNKFTPQEIEEMSGLANILQVTKRAGQYIENPPTGDRWGVPILGVSAGYASPAAAGTTASIVALTRFLTGTTVGKKLAMAASNIEPTNPNMKVLIKIIYNQLPRMAGATRSY